MVVRSRTLSSAIGSAATRASSARSAPEQNTGPAARMTVAPIEGSPFSAPQAATRSRARSSVMLLRRCGALRVMMATPSAVLSTSTSVIGGGPRLRGPGIGGLGLGGLDSFSQSLEPELGQVRIVSHAPIVDHPPGGVGHHPAPAVAVPVARPGQRPDHVRVGLVHPAVVFVEDVAPDLDLIDLVEDHVLDQIHGVAGRAFGQEYEAARMPEPGVRPVQAEEVRKAGAGDSEVGPSVILAPL